MASDSELRQVLYDFLEDYKAAGMTAKLDAVIRATGVIKSLFALAAAPIPQPAPADRSWPCDCNGSPSCCGNASAMKPPAPAPQVCGTCGGKGEVVRGYEAGMMLMALCPCGCRPATPGDGRERP